MAIKGTVRRYESLLIVVFFFGVLALLMREAVVGKTMRARTVAGVMAFGFSALMFLGARWVETANHRVWYGTAARKLLDATTEAIDAGKAAEVSRELKAMRKELNVTYESRGNFKELAEETVVRLKGMQPAGASDRR